MGEAYAAAITLLARRLAERGVRFIQLYHPGWDNHLTLPQDLPKLARAGPGTAVSFREVTVEEAWELRRRADRDFKWLQTGLNLLK